MMSLEATDLNPMPAIVGIQPKRARIDCSQIYLPRLLACRER
jgi:hypothetical protein